MYIIFFPAIKEQSANMEQLLKSYPESFLKAFNFDIRSLNTVEGFLSTEQFSFVWPLMVIFMMIGFGGGAFAGEIEKGTIEILLAQPVSRLKIFFGRYLAGLFVLIIFTTLSVYAAIPFCKIYNIDINTAAFNKMALLSFLFAWAIYGLAIMLSAMFSDKGKVFFISGGLLVLMYVLKIVASIKDSLSDLKFASFFYYYDPTKALLDNEIDKWAFVVFWSVAIICTLIGAIWFAKRDIAA